MAQGTGDGKTTRARLLIASLIGLAALAATVGTSCEPAPDTYVALGDSSVAGPLIPTQVGLAGCMRSDHNYPSLTASAISAKVAKFADHSCSGATTWNLTHGQDVSDGTNPPQLDGLDATTKVVTVGIGANDMDLVGIVTTCYTANPFGAGCHDSFNQTELNTRITNTAAAYRTVLAQIHDRAPNAVIFSVESPDPLPATGSGCYPVSPILPQDIDWARSLFARYQSAMRTVEDQSNVVHVALPGRTQHHLCSSDRWVEPLIPGSAVLPFHANGNGHAAMASALSAAINNHFQS